MRTVWVWLWILLMGTGSAHAESLFYDSCIKQAASQLNEANLVLVATDGAKFMGLTCEDLKRYGDAAKAIDMSLYPATLAVTLTPARDIIASEIAALGLSMANPAVLGVTVVGAFGAVTVYFILKRSMDECEQMEREQLKSAILNEIEQRYGIHGEGQDIRFRK